MKRKYSVDLSKEERLHLAFHSQMPHKRNYPYNALIVLKLSFRYV